MAIYLKFDGVKIEGNVTTKGFEKQVQVDSFQFGVGRAITMNVGGAHDRVAGNPSISEISLTKSLDNASMGIFQEALLGKKGFKVIITIVHGSADKIDKDVEYKLEDVLISSYSVSSGGDRPHESFSLSFTKIEALFAGSDAKGAAGAQMRVGYDLAKGTKF
jgi:type VI secretion system secreted protein Hcp